jgi:two-component system, cell cycle sensor histidine kinase and response regulator CckA
MPTMIGRRLASVSQGLRDLLRKLMLTVSYDLSRRVHPANRLPPLAQAQVFALLEGVPLGAYVFHLEDPDDAASLRIVFANSASADTLGIEAALVVGSLIGEYFPRSVSDTDFAAAYREVAITQVRRDFGVVSYGDESLENARFTLAAYPLGRDKVVILFDNLSASPVRTQELAAIVNSAADAILSKDLEGTILSWNLSAERIYGYSEGEAVGRSISMLLPADRPHEVSDLIKRLQAREHVDQFETKRVRKDGTIIDVSLTISPLTDRRGVVVGASTICRDVSEEKEIAGQLHRIAAIVAASEDAITSRAPDGIILSWNAAAERLFGYSAEEMIGQPVDILASGTIADEVEGIRARMQRGERRRSPYEARVRRKDGSEVLVSVSSSPITNDAGELVGIASVLRDMTDHRRLEDQLRQSQKMEAIGSLAGGVAHDFNNVLTVIATASEAALGKLGPGALRDTVRQIDLAAQHAATLTGQLLALSRQQVLLPEQIDLNAIVTSTCEMAGRLVGEHVRIELQLGEGLAAVEMDRGQLQQVILNLLVNARDAMENGGELTVRTAGVVIDESYLAEHFEVALGEYVLLEVTDTGTGMDPATSSRIFDPFFTTKAQGTGLGLATVYGIVKQSGGQIFVYSELGIGTTFKVYLPPSRTPASRPAVVAATEPESQTGTETILLVEDADLLRPMLAETLAAQGYTVLAAADGDEALGIFESFDGTIDLLLTDIVMPRISGRELAEQLLAKAPTMRILFTSGYPDDSSTRKLIAEQHVGFIQKPYAGNELLAKIRATLATPRS